MYLDERWEVLLKRKFKRKLMSLVISLATNITKIGDDRGAPTLVFSDNMSRHISIVHCDTTFKDDHCNKSFAEKDHLKRPQPE